MIDFGRAAFLTSAAALEGCPADYGAEVAFAGRSNAGKSSALNRLTRQKNLARTSKTPGRTQLINFFALSDQQRLVDLPGYGFAKVPTAVQRRWGEFIGEYLTQREALTGLILLMDVRHPMKDQDVQLIDWAQDRGLPIHVLLTKADKLKRGAAQNQLLAVRRELPPEGCTVQLFSALKGDGLEDAKRVISSWLT